MNASAFILFLTLVCAVLIVALVYAINQER